MFIPSKRIRDAVISQALSPRGQAFLRACNGKTIVEDERGWVTIVTGDGRVVTTAPAIPGPGAVTACGTPEMASDEGR
ncbi:hypothetical protein [Nannocystis sp.]|uniref:hypothetical protein n=1 Tax=Nannocystis sp. TaxID=1962667 RepID=UPI0025F12470|nr:hypothetical protein [Nannocystis sp.]MBK7828584.1 hypothetical protein [Nannocystis sp.]